MIPGAVMGRGRRGRLMQPGRLAALLCRAEEIEQGRQVRVLPDPLAGTVLIARGSSDHAATTGRYLLELATGRPVASASPSLYTMYGAHTDFTGFLVIGVSQSGGTPEIVRSVQAARTAGGRTVAVTNDSSSPLAQAAEVTVCLGVGPEQAVPATKTVTAELAVFALIAQAAGDVGFGPQVRDRLPGQVATVLEDPGPAKGGRRLASGPDPPGDGGPRARYRTRLELVRLVGGEAVSSGDRVPEARERLFVGGRLALWDIGGPQAGVGSAAAVAAAGDNVARPPGEIDVHLG